MKSQIKLVALMLMSIPTGMTAVQASTVQAVHEAPKQYISLEPSKSSNGQMSMRISDEARHQLLLSKFRYATQSVPPIHIIVNHGTVTLKGVVASKADSQLAFMAANGISGVFEVKNELRVSAHS